MKNKYLLSSFVILFLLGFMSFISATLIPTLYDSANINQVSTYFNSTDILNSFDAGGYYKSSTSSGHYYSIFQKTSQGIKGFNMSAFMIKQTGSGQDLQIGFGSKQIASAGNEVSMACGIGNQPTVVYNGYLIGISRTRTQYGVYKIINGGATLLGTCKTMSDPGSGTFFPINLTYDGSTVEVYVNGVKDTISDSTYTLSSSTAFGESIYYGTVNGGKVGVKNMYVFNEGPTNTCTYSGSGNWNISLGDYCIISNSLDLTSQNISYYGTGNLTFNSSLTFCHTDFTNNKFYITSLGQLIGGKC